MQFLKNTYFSKVRLFSNILRSPFHNHLSLSNNTTTKLVVLLCCFCITQSCFQSGEPKMGEEDIWKLSWRMFLNAESDLKTAELQFDSLLNTGRTIDKNFLKAGIDIKAKLGKDTAKLMQQFAEQFKEEIEAPAENKALQRELIKLYIEDQEVRGNWMTDIIEKYDIDTSQITRYADGTDIDFYNRSRLKEIIKKHGFPTVKLVGKDAMRGVFFIIQHADGDRPWQASQLKNIEKAVNDGDLIAERYAYLYDRIKKGNGEKQLYGSQFELIDVEKNIYDFAPIEDIENLNKRRMKMGMMPAEMYKSIHNQIVQNSMK